ncbi:MAG: DUF302 domain-containing protein [Proteobacteria bacterium]|jgi:uncharacterized protein (DUF302 family)|nr:DUF302 domain-containing protein [Pseudomonadota bacterium]MCG6936517.1 DUF302 domain-containing protein [Pseudomonadota bacterium]
MIRKSVWPLILAVLGLLLVRNALAQDLLMARVPMTFPEAMSKLQETLKKHKQTLSRVQRVDIGLTSKGYKTDKYRVVFFGRADEVQDLINQYPEFIPYLPHKIAVFAEQDETVLVAANPEHLFKSDNPKKQAIVKRWHADLEKIFHDMRQE